MMTTTPDRGRLGANAPGLVVMLDLAGQTIAALEDRVNLLEEALVAERRERSRVEAMLDELRRQAGREAEDLDTANVDPSSPGPADNDRHDRPATPPPTGRAFPMD